MELETAYASFFFTAITCNLLSILAARLLLTLSTPWLYTSLTLIVALPLGSYTLTYISIWPKLPQRDVSQASSDSPDSRAHADDSDIPSGIIPTTALSCISTMQRYFILWSYARIDLGHLDSIELVYALGLVELFVILRLGSGFRRAFHQSRGIVEDACEKGLLGGADNLNKCIEKS